MKESEFQLIKHRISNFELKMNSGELKEVDEKVSINGDIEIVKSES